MSDEKYGPQTEHVEALLGRVRTLSAGEMSALANEWNPWVAYDGWSAAWGKRRLTELDTVMNEVWHMPISMRVLSVVQDAAVALVTRDLLPREHYDPLSGPWRHTIGKIHPDDEEMTEKYLENERTHHEKHNVDY